MSRKSLRARLGTVPDFRHGPLVAFFLLIGVASSAYEAAALRLYAVASDAVALPRYSWLNPVPHTGRRLYEIRAAYESIRSKLGREAIVQQNPGTDPGDLPWALYAERRTVADTPTCDTAMGGDPKQCAAVMLRIAPLFQGALKPEEVDAICQELGISALVVKDTDPVWSAPGSWVWRWKADISGDRVRVFFCGRQ